ncbi:hypothetical protein MRX96_000662 [Rhipicephalus microplus]
MPFQEIPISPSHPSCRACEGCVVYGYAERRGGLRGCVEVGRVSQRRAVAAVAAPSAGVAFLSICRPVVRARSSVGRSNRLVRARRSSESDQVLIEGDARTPRSGPRRRLRRPTGNSSSSGTEATGDCGPPSGRSTAAKAASSSTAPRSTTTRSAATTPSTTKEKGARANTARSSSTRALRGRPSVASSPVIRSSRSKDGEQSTQKGLEATKSAKNKQQYKNKQAGKEAAVDGKGRKQQKQKEKLGKDQAATQEKQSKYAKKVDKVKQVKEPKLQKEAQLDKESAQQPEPAKYHKQDEQPHQPAEQLQQAPKDLCADSRNQQPGSATKCQTGSQQVPVTQAAAPAAAGVGPSPVCPPIEDVDGPRLRTVLRLSRHGCVLRRDGQHQGRLQAPRAGRPDPRFLPSVKREGRSCSLPVTSQLPLLPPPSLSILHFP